MPTVIHLVISLAHGGLEQLVVNWTNKRNRRRPGSTFICCLDEPGELADQVEGNAVFCVDAKRERFPWDVFAVRRLHRLLMATSDANQHPAFRIQIVHSHNLAAQQYALPATLGTNVKHVYTQHGANIHNQGFKDRLRSRMLSWFTDRIVAVSDSTAETMAGKQKIPRDTTTVIPNGVSPHPAYSREEIDALRKKLGIPENAFTIGSVGRLAHVKGYDRLLRAFASVVRDQISGEVQKQTFNIQHPTSNVEREKASTPMLLLVGDGPEREALETQAKNLGLRDHVIFAGYQREPREFLEIMDLFVLPSRSEGLSIALLEAMAADCVVMVTDVGENREVIDNGNAGFLLPNDDAEWAAVIRRQMTEGGRRTAKEKAERGKRRVEERFSLEATLEAYETVYHELKRSCI